MKPDNDSSNPSAPILSVLGGVGRSVHRWRGWRSLVDGTTSQTLVSMSTVMVAISIPSTHSPALGDLVHRCAPRRIPHVLPGIVQVRIDVHRSVENHRACGRTVPNNRRRKGEVRA